MSAYNQILLKTRWPYFKKELDEALTYFGGDPKLPPETPWPTIPWRGAELPLHFIAQFDCSNLPSCEGRHLLPESGILYFFAVMMDDAELRQEDCWQAHVIFLNAPKAQLRLRAAPAGLAGLHPMTRGRRPWVKDVLGTQAAEDETKRFAFCPLETVAMTAPTGHTMYTEELEFELEAAYAAAMAPLAPNPGDLINDPEWPETVLQALDMLGRWGPLKYHEDMLSAIDAGTPWDDAALCKNKFWANGDTDARRKLIAEWRSLVEARNYDLATAQTISTELKRYEPLSVTPAELRQETRRLTDKLGAGSWPSEDVTFSVMLRLPVDAVPFSKTSVALARYRSENPTLLGTNYHHLLGPSLPHQSDHALMYFKRFGILDAGATGADIVQILTLGSDMPLDACFGDANELHFYAPRIDLEHGKFDRVISLIMSI